MTATRAARSCCLVLMLKAPWRSKRRLGEIGTEAAERLFACAAEDLAGWPGPTCFAPASRDDARWLVERVGPAALVVEQRGANLGERIEHVGARLRASGHERQLFIGIDCPELGPGTLGAAASRLETADAVLGPARDGGVVLMGTRRRWPALSALPWSTNALGDELGKALERSGFSVAVLDTFDDVDCEADLAALAPRLTDDTRPARRALRAWLTSNRARLRIEA